MKNGPYTFQIAPQDYPGMRYRDRYVYEHTLSWWKATGTVPPKGFEIHHINGNHRDNDIRNLVLLPRKVHQEYHHEQRRVPRKKFECGWCKKDGSARNRDYRDRIEKNKFKKLFCSARCGSLHQHSVRNSVKVARQLVTL